MMAVDPPAIWVLLSLLAILVHLVLGAGAADCFEQLAQPGGSTMLLAAGVTGAGAGALALAGSAARDKRLRESRRARAIALAVLAVLTGLVALWVFRDDFMAGSGGLGKVGFPILGKFYCQLELFQGRQQLAWELPVGSLCLWVAWVMLLGSLAMKRLRLGLLLLIVALAGLGIWGLLRPSSHPTTLKWKLEQTSVPPLPLAMPEEIGWARVVGGLSFPDAMAAGLTSASPEIADDLVRLEVEWAGDPLPYREVVLILDDLELYSRGLVMVATSRAERPEPWQRLPDGLQETWAEYLGELAADPRHAAMREVMLELGGEELPVNPFGAPK